MSIAYVNGKFVDTETPQLFLNDIGFLRGYGVYEGITSYKGKVFHLKDHYERLVKSASFLGIPVQISFEELEKVFAELIAKNNFPRTDFRIVLTGGLAIDGIDFNPATPTLVVVAEEHKDLPKEVYEKGAKVILDEFGRQTAEYKTLNYINAVRLQEKRKKAGATEIVYHHAGKLLEASTSNVFIVKDNIVVTPDKNILEGITRKVVIELAREAGYKIEEREVAMEEFFIADEVFISSSFKEIVPVVQADDKKVGSGVVGSVTKDLVDRFNRLT